RGSNARFKGGYGIGLSLVRQIVRLHNAELFINSNENVGTTFEICFNKEAAEQV
ncbi:MAG: ATP-binding protein, partial [Lentimicrobium sp.]|nr:ATP-binding protein [Lentimicrobium sp.]